MIHRAWRPRLSNDYSLRADAVPAKVRGVKHQRGGQGAPGNSPLSAGRQDPRAGARSAPGPGHESAGCGSTARILLNGALRKI